MEPVSSPFSKTAKKHKSAAAKFSALSPWKLNYNSHMKIKGYSHSVVGSRDNNEDSFLVFDESALYAVADGIGGGEKGEVASKMATEGLKANYAPEKGLRDIFRVLQVSVINNALQMFGSPVMGTTLTAVKLEKNQVSLCHVGDSRCYFYDGNILQQMTVDHEHYDERYHGNVLDSYLGLDPTVLELKIQEESFSVVPGNRILLCSDGLYKQMSDEQIANVIKKNFGSPKQIVETLCSTASKAEGSDNVTVVLIEIDFEDMPEEEKSLP